MNPNPVTNGFVKPVPTEEEQAKVTLTLLIILELGFRSDL